MLQWMLYYIHGNAGLRLLAMVQTALVVLLDDHPPYVPRRLQQPIHPCLVWLLRVATIHLWKPTLQTVEDYVYSLQTRRHRQSGYPLGYVRPKRHRRKHLTNVAINVTTVSGKETIGADQRPSPTRSISFDTDAIPFLLILLLQLPSRMI